MKKIIILILLVSVICCSHPKSGFVKEIPNSEQEKEKILSNKTMQTEYKQTELTDNLEISYESVDITWSSVIGSLSPDLVVTSDTPSYKDNPRIIQIINLNKDDKKYLSKKEYIFSGKRVNTLVIPNIGLFVCGKYDKINGSIYKYPICKINTNGEIDYTFNADWSLDLEPELMELYHIDGKLLVCTGIDSYRNTMTKIIMTTEFGQLVNDFINPNIYLQEIGYESGTINIVGKKIYMLSRKEGDTRNGAPATLFRFNIDGSLDVFFHPIEFDAQSIIDIKEQSNGKIIICGGVYRSLDEKWYQLIRYENNGELDSSFIRIENSTVFINDRDKSSAVYGMIILKNDDIIIIKGGLFLIPKNGSREISHMLIDKEDFYYVLGIIKGINHKLFINYQSQDESLNTISVGM